MRAGVVVHGAYAAGLEFEFGDADSVFDEENLFGAALEDVEGTVFVPLSGGLAEGFVGGDLYGYITERLVRQVARYVGKGGGGEAGFAVLEPDRDGRLVFYGVDYLGGA